MSSTLNEQAVAIIPAAGVGKRMGAEIPKQYLSCAGKPIVWYALKQFEQCPWIDRIFVALSSEDSLWSTYIGDAFPQVELVTGGASRAESVRNALRVASKSYPKTSWALVHDAARPCLSRADLDSISGQLSTGTEQGFILADKLHDTIKLADSALSIQSTLDRSHMWRALTPQVFQLGDLLDALESVSLESVTDEASAMEQHGHDVKLLQGDARNIKVTQKADLALAELFLKQLETE